MKRLSCAALILFAFGPAFGQRDDLESIARPSASPTLVRAAGLEAEAARLLKSDVNAERAWGAHLVGLHAMREQSAALVQVIEDPSLGGGWEESLVRQAALDSLIRLQVKVPAASLRPLKDSSPDEVIILLGLAPEENQKMLLEMFAGELYGARWLAVGNLLAEVRAAGFAALLLREMKIEVDVTVLDYEGDFGGGGFGSSGGCGDGVSPLPEGFPEVGFYALTSEVERGAVVAAPGKYTAFYVRTPSRNGCAGYGTFGAGARDFYRLEYVRGLLGVEPDGLDFDVAHDRTVVCKDPSQCRPLLDALRREIEQSHAALVKRLVYEDLLDGADADALRPDITFNLRDERKDKSSPLPESLEGVKLSFN